MSFSLAAALVVALQAQSGQIGELSMEAFLRLLSGMGYTTSNSSDSCLALSDGATSLNFGVSFGRREGSKENFVHMATGRVEFDVSRTLAKKYLLDWRAREKLEKVSVSSFLGGKVALTMHLASPRDTSDEVRANVKMFFDAYRRLKSELAPLGGKQSDRLYEVGKAPLDLETKLEDVDPEDLDYLREVLRWGNRVVPGGGRGWNTGAEPLGVPMIFSGMASSKTGFFLTCMGRSDVKTLERLSAKAESITWARVVVWDGSYHIQKWLDTSGGITVRELRDQILDFAVRVKALDLFHSSTPSVSSGLGRIPQLAGQFP